MPSLGITVSHRITREQVGQSVLYETEPGIRYVVTLYVATRSLSSIATKGANRNALDRMDVRL